MDEKFIITLRIQERVYRLKINRKDEARFRDAALAIEKKTNQYRSQYEGNNSQNMIDSDYLAMTAIQALSETEALESKNKYFENRINGLINELDSYLKDNR